MPVAAQRIVVTTPSSSENATCRSNDGAITGGRSVTPAGRLVLPACIDASSRARSIQRMSMSSPAVIPRTTTPQHGISTSPTTAAPSAAGSVPIASTPSSTPPGIAQYHKGSVTMPRTPTHNPIARLETTGPA